MGVGVDALALAKEHLAVAALTAADEEDEVVAGGKLRDALHAVGHGTADGVERAEGGRGGYVAADILNDAVKLVERLRGLRVEVDVAGEVKTLRLVETFNDDGRAFCLPDKAKNLGMAFLTKDDDGSPPYCPRGGFNRR